MRHLVAAEKHEETQDIPDNLPPLKCDVHYAIKTWLQHRLHHTYPRAGGYDDQDADLMDDWHTLSLYFIRVEKGVFTQIQMPTNAPHIESLLGG